MLEIKFEDDKAKVFTPYNPDFVTRIKQIDKASWDSTERCWVVPSYAVNSVRIIMLDVYGVSDLENTSKRAEIGKVLSGIEGTVLSFPDRGPWGNAHYGGPCSGYVQAFLIEKYGVETMAELFSGSGTGSDVSNDMGINYVGADLNPNPVRPDILTVDAINDEVPEEFLGADMIFMHPPYGAEIGISYAGEKYPDPTGELSRLDLSNMPWDVFIPTLNKVILKYYVTLKPGARLAILVGEVRRHGKYYSMSKDIVKPDNLEQILIKLQHNCSSDNKKYSNNDSLIRISHETLYVFRKPFSTYGIGYSIQKHHEMI